jgi:RNA polymerase sigma factor (sigma-70 family)
MSIDPLDSKASFAASDSSTGPADVERLFREHNSALLRFVAAKVGSEEEAREIAQQAYVQLLQLDRPEAISYLRAFLFKTAANLAVDRLRQRTRRSNISSPEEDDFAVFELSPERQLAGEQALAVVRNAIRELPPKCRQAFLLHRIHELQVDEIAERMHIGACMVRRYISRALEYVRQRVDAAYRQDKERQP